MTDSDNHINIETDQEKTVENGLQLDDKQAEAIAKFLLVLAEAIKEIVEN